MEQYIEFIGNNPLLSGIWLVLFFAITYHFFQAKLSAFKRVNNSQLTQLVNKEDAIVVDVRAKDDYKKGHIAGAKHLLLTQIEQGEIGTLEKQKDTPIILVCTAGLSAAKGANKLVKEGFTQVHLLEGGMNSWTGANLPLVKS